MPNFFKKLTSSFKMGEDDIFEDEPKENADPKDAEEEETEVVEGDLGAEDGYPKDRSGGSDENAPYSEEKPYTIAELAQAHTARTESRTSKTSKAILPSISLHKKEEIAENGLNMPEGQLAIDVYETPSEIVIKSTIAGAKPEELDIGIEDNTVNIRGTRHNEEKVKGEDYLYQECYWGTFSRSIILPTEVDSDKAEASMKDGVLTVRIPKLKREREKKIKVMA